MFPNKTKRKHIRQRRSLKMCDAYTVVVHCLQPSIFAHAKTFPYLGSYHYGCTEKTRSIPPGPEGGNPGWQTWWPSRTSSTKHHVQYAIHERYMSQVLKCTRKVTSLCSTDIMVQHNRFCNVRTAMLFCGPKFANSTKYRFWNHATLAKAKKASPPSCQTSNLSLGTYSWCWINKSVMKTQLVRTLGP